MASQPWWIQQVTELLQRPAADQADIGAHWQLCERLRFVRENVEPQLLATDFAAFPHSREQWSAFLRCEERAGRALQQSVNQLAERFRRGAIPPHQFRAGWEQLGFAPNVHGAGTPADDYLDGVFQISRITTGEPAPPGGNPNMSSRAQRISDFLQVAAPSASDVVFDLGSGSGKLALTVSASCATQVKGVEYGEAYVAEARKSAAFLSLGNVSFVQADVRDCDLAPGSIFYLYYPFRGKVAQTVAHSLGKLAKEKSITVYSAGPQHQYGEYFLQEVAEGRLSLDERRGEFSEVMVLRSAR